MLRAAASGPCRLACVVRLLAGPPFASGHTRLAAPPVAVPVPAFCLFRPRCVGPAGQAGRRWGTDLGPEPAARAGRAAAARPP